MQKINWQNLALAIGVVAMSYGVWDIASNKWWAERSAPKVDVSQQPGPPRVTSSLEREDDTEWSDMDRSIHERLKRLFVLGDFAGARAQAEAILLTKQGSEVFQSWVLAQIPVLLTSEGWLKLKTGDCQEARKLFFKALTSRSMPEARKGIGYCSYLDKNWPEAQTFLAPLMAELPEDLDVRVIYVETLESLGEFETALVILNETLARGNLTDEQKKSLNERLAAMRAKAREGSAQRREQSQRFFLSYREGDHDDVVAEVFERLERGTDEFLDVLGLPPLKAPIEVILYRKESFAGTVPGMPQWSEGVFDGRIRIPVPATMNDRTRDIFITSLRHELSHALVSSWAIGRRFPPWFDEGLAQYLACRGRACAGFRFGAAPATFLSEHNFTVPFLSLSTMEAGRAYAQSLFLVTRAVDLRGGEPSLSRVFDVIPSQGPILSDRLASAWDFESFKAMVSWGEGLWKQRL